jgi:hypothetical protein
MKPTTRKLSGPAMERLLRQVIVGEGVDGALAARLAARLARVLSSVRARRVPLQALRQTAAAPPASALAVPPSTAAQAPAAALAAVAPPATMQAPAAKFDPYAFGLVPIFQREGRDGLLARLAGVGTADDLKAMARAQQIALEAALKEPDVPLATLRDGIAAAVEKRIADRKAAAR